MKEEHVRWYTPYLSRDFEMLVFGHSGAPVILFPTSMGRHYQNRDFKLIDSVAPLVDAGRVKIYCPDAVDEESWYNNSIHPADRVKTHMAYERVILHEVVERARWETGAERVAVGGCSFGGYHAANLAFRNPDKIGAMISLGGSFDIRQFIYGHYDEDCYFNNPVDYLPGLSDPWYLDRIRSMGIVLGTGEWDICREANEAFSRILHDKGISHWLDVRPGAVHDWPAWCEAFPTYLSQIARS
jgi:esterase/lipase superfamily enzyme